MPRRILLALALALVVLLYWSRPRWPEPAAGSTLVLALTGELPETLAPTALPPRAAWLARWLRLPDGQADTPLSMLEIAEVLRAAARDERITRLRIEPAGLRAGWAKLEELRSWLAVFRRSGKPVDCYLRSPGMKEYFVATAAGRIALAPSGWLNLRGLRAEVISFKGALDKLGVVAEMEAIGKYKDAGDAVTRDGMSPETREVLDSFLDARLAAWLEAVSVGRRKAVADVRRLLDDGPYLATRARAVGLVDALEFAPDPPPGVEVPAGEYRWTLRPRGSARVAVLVVEGGTGAAEARRLREAVREVTADSFRGVLVRVNSPGGEVVTSDEMLHQLEGLRRKLPLVFSFSDMAASGGYALAMTGDPLYASPGTVTGSIGVLFGKVDASGFYSKLGLRKELLVRGNQAAIDSEVRPLGEEGRRRLRAALEEMYGHFVGQVAGARRLDRARVAAVAEGRAWLGSQALAHGLVDSVEGWNGALAAMKKKLGLRHEESLELEMFPQRETWLDRAASGDVAGEVLGEAAVALREMSGGALLRRPYYDIAIE